MLGVVLIYVGVVLILNGVGRLCNVDAKSSAVIHWYAIIYFKYCSSYTR